MAVTDDVATTKSLIESQISTADSRSADILSRTFDAINNLNGVASEVPPSIDFIAPSVNVNVPLVSGVSPDRPTAAISAIKAAIGATPGDFAASIDERAMQDAPQEQFSVPTITFPTSPVFDDLVVPSALAISLPDDIPDVPVVTLPSDLTVGNQTIPNIPTISLPSFGEVLPTLDIDLPETTFAYVEPVYTSALKDAITSKLLDGVNNGGTGLGATVQTDIWNQDIERLEQQKDDDVEKTLNLFGGRGFDMPTGMVAMQVQEILKTFANDRAQNSRTISIEEARIAKEMTQFFLSTGLSLEQIELNHANNVANRALEAEKAVVQFSIDLFNSKVSKFNLELERYKSKQIEAETLLKIQELILAQYRAELEGVDIQLRQDAIKIENYNALLKSHDISIKLYEAEIGAVVAQMNIERAKVEIFKGEIDAYVAQLQAQKNEYDLYLAQIEGERAKIDIHKTEVEAYATRVNAVKVSNDVVVAQINADIATEEMNLKAHLANIDLYKAKSDQALTEISQEASLYRTDGAIFEALLRHAQSQAELNVQTQIRTEALTQANANMSLEAARANLQALLESNRIRVEASKGQATASSAMAGMIGGAIQGMLQLGGQGTSIETTES
jgi:hypothetical protein